MGFRVSGFGVTSAVLSMALAISTSDPGERQFFIDNLLVRIDFVIVMIRWTGLAPWEVEGCFHRALLQRRLWIPPIEFSQNGVAGARASDGQ